MSLFFDGGNSFFPLSTLSFLSWLLRAKMFIGLGTGSWLEMGLGIEGIEGASRGAFRNMFRVWFGGPLWSPFGLLLGLLFQVGLEGLFEVILGCVWD